VPGCPGTGEPYVEGRQQEIVRRARARGTVGVAALADQPPPDRELTAEAVGERLDTLADVVAAAHRVREWGAGAGALAEGLARGGAAVGLPGSRMPGPADLLRHAVRLQPGPDGVRPPLTR